MTSNSVPTSSSNDCHARNSSKEKDHNPQHATCFELLKSDNPTRNQCKLTPKRSSLELNSLEDTLINSYADPNMQATQSDAEPFENDALEDEDEESPEKIYAKLIHKLMNS